VRLGVYTDLVYRRDGEILSTDLSFILFVTALAPRIDELVLFGRLDPRPGRSPYVLPRQNVRLVPLPHYERVTHVRALVRSVAVARRRFAAELERLDAVWLFGPHPLALEFARVAARCRVRVFLGVRQQFPRYIGNRLPGRTWVWAIPVAHALERAFLRLARRCPTVVVGEDLGIQYRRSGGPVLVTGFSLVRERDVASAEQALSRPWDGELRLLNVGRLESDKNPLLLPEILAGLRRIYSGWRLVTVGSGELEPAVARRAAALGVTDQLDLRGYVPLGEALWDEYRSGTAFLHVSLTEGLPQVLYEAMATGLPIVATDVGGVAAALAQGRRGLLIPPNDVPAAVDALERLRKDVNLRRDLILAGLSYASEETLDAQTDRVLRFFVEQRNY
jgi:glycosyltransferase involved in cell wall biosynthesis